MGTVTIGYLRQPYPPQQCPITRYHAHLKSARGWGARGSGTVSTRRGRRRGGKGGDVKKLKIWKGKGSRQMRCPVPNVILVTITRPIHHPLRPPPPLCFHSLLYSVFSPLSFTLWFFFRFCFLSTLLFIISFTCQENRENFLNVKPFHTGQWKTFKMVPSLITA